MSRDVLERLDDMIEAAERIVEWTPQGGAAALVADVRLRYQIERAVQIWGEAAKHVPAEWKARAPEFPWREAAGMRDVLAHAYFDIDPEVLVSVGQDALPAVLPVLRRIRALAAAESDP